MLCEVVVRDLGQIFLQVAGDDLGKRLCQGLLQLGQNAGWGNQHELIELPAAMLRIVGKKARERGTLDLGA